MSWEVVVVVLGALVVASAGIVLRQPNRARRRDARIEWSALKQDDWDLRGVEVEVERGAIDAAKAALSQLAGRAAVVDRRAPARLRRFHAMVVGVERYVSAAGTGPSQADLAAAVNELRTQIASIQSAIQDEGRRADRHYWIGSLLILVGLALAIAELLRAR